MGVFNKIAKSVSGAASVWIDSLLAGELGAGTSDGMLRTLELCQLSVISKTTACTIGAGGTNDTALIQISVTKALTGTCVITGFADTNGTAQSFSLPIGFVGERNFHGARNAAGPLTITCSDVADDNLVQVLWAAAPAS